MYTKALLVASALFLNQPSLAADAYPDQTITIVTPYAAGSDTDVYARMFGQHAAPLLGAQKIDYETRQGKSGALASVHVRSAKPDGYTLLVARVGSHAITPAMSINPDYTSKDFVTLAILGTNPMICAVRAKQPYRSIRDVLQAIRKNPGKLVYSTASPTSIQYLATQYLLALSGLPSDAAKALHFDSAVQATDALLDGRADFLCNNANTLIPQIKEGRLRGLFTTAQGRMSALPDLLNAREVGLRDMANIQGWTALVGPANLPEAVKDKWKKVFTTLASDPAWLSGNERFGGQSALSAIKDPERFVYEQYVLYEKLITRLDIRQ